MPVNVKMHAATEKVINILGPVILPNSGTNPNRNATET